MTERLGTNNNQVQRNPDLNKLWEDITEYLKNNNLRIFHGCVISSSEFNKVLEVEYISDENNWKDYIDVAISDNQKFLIVDIFTFKKDFIDYMDKNLLPPTGVVQ